MIYVFNKNKILSYIVASFIVLFLFVFSTTLKPTQEVELIKVSANTVNSNLSNDFKE